MWRIKEVTKEEELLILSTVYYSDTSKTGLRLLKDSKNHRYKKDEEAFRCINEAGYYQGSINRRTFSASRVVYFLLHGVWVDYVKHLDGNPLNNHASNLSEVVKPRIEVEPIYGKHHVYGFGSTKSRLVWESCFVAQPRQLHSGAGLAD